MLFYRIQKFSKDFYIYFIFFREIRGKMHLTKMGSSKCPVAGNHLISIKIYRFRLGTRWIICGSIKFVSLKITEKVGQSSMKIISTYRRESAQNNSFKVFTVSQTNKFSIGSNEVVAPWPEMLASSIILLPMIFEESLIFQFYYNTKI